MKKYTNKTIYRKRIEFEDDVVFLRRGASYFTDKEAIALPKGVKVAEVRKTKQSSTKNDEATDSKTTGSTSTKKES